MRRTQFSMSALKIRRQFSGRVNFLTVSVAILLLVGLVAFLSRLFFFLWIFDGKHPGIRITQPQAASAHSTLDTRPQVVPKIIHQVFHNWKDPTDEKLPDDWEATRKTCVDKNPGWEYKLWTDRTSREFLAKEYPTFLRTYDSYRFPVQKVDSLRYFLMLHYGGIYLDLDNGCKESLEPLLYYDAWVTDGGHGALSNNILGARPHHPFWLLVTQSLEPYNRNLLLPYLVISYASGQWFLTEMWNKYHAALPPVGSPDNLQENRLYQLMMDMRTGADPWVFFTQGRGGSWDNWDNHFFSWLGNLSQSVPVFICLMVLAGGAFFVIRRKCRLGRGYRRATGHAELGGA